MPPIQFPAVANAMTIYGLVVGCVRRAMITTSELNGNIVAPIMAPIKSPMYPHSTNHSIFLLYLLYVAERATIVQYDDNKGIKNLEVLQLLSSFEDNYKN